MGGTNGAALSLAFCPQRPSGLGYKRWLEMTGVCVRRLILMATLGAAEGLVASAAADPLQTVRYRDPTEKGSVQLGYDIGGIYVPASWGLLERSEDPDIGEQDVSTVRHGPAWAMALGSRIAVAGRHQMIRFSADDRELRVTHHELQLSGRPFFDPQRDPTIHERAAVGLEYHDVNEFVVGGQDFSVGGVTDRVFHLGYGLEHSLWRHYFLAYRLQWRWAKLGPSKQQHLRAATRVGWELAEGHEIFAEGVLFFVMREEEQRGKALPTETFHAQMAGQYHWMSDYHLGLFVEGRAFTGFLSGQAPVYELETSALSQRYAEVTFGVRTELH